MDSIPITFIPSVTFHTGNFLEFLFELYTNIFVISSWTQICNYPDLILKTMGAILKNVIFHG